MSSRTRAEIGLAATTVIWGSTFVVVKSALTEISPIPFLALRFLVAAFVLAAIYGRRMSMPALLPGILAGGLLFTAYVFQTVGLETTTPSQSAFLTGLSIPMVPLAASLVYRIKPRAIEVCGILAASAGMALMTFPAAHITINRGDLFSFLCALVFALHLVVIGHYSPVVGFEALAVTQVLTAAVLGCALAGLLKPFSLPAKFHMGPQVAVAVLVTGLLATALAFTVMAWAQQYTSATRSALIFSLEPVVAWFTSWLLTGEVLSTRAIGGAALILAGILLVELKPELKRTRPRQHPVIERVETEQQRPGSGDV